MPDLTKMSKDELVNVLMIEIDYYRNARKHHPDEPRGKGSDVAEMLAGETEKALAELTRRTEVPKGHVKLDDQRVVKVLGTLPMTADGCVLGGSVTVYAHYCGDILDGYSPKQTCRFYDDGSVSWVESSVCYSTRESALAAQAKGVEG